MEKKISVSIKHKFPGMNEIVAASKSHWGRYSKMKAAETAIVLAAVREQVLFKERLNLKKKPEVPFAAPRHAYFTDPVNIEITFFEDYTGRKRDWDNVTAAKKFILDGLVGAGVIVDDSPRWIHSITEMVRYADVYSVEIFITDI